VTAKPITKPILGWREWIALPQLGIERIKAKVDTGARTSALHAFNVRLYEEDGKRFVSFMVHPIQGNTEKTVKCTAKVKDERLVTDSGGHKEHRLVIETAIKIGDHQRTVEVTLTDRDNMLFRMLLGRTAIRPHFLVDPNKSFLSTKQ
jgi:hypothetical protein